jgi:hypothetical protein
MTQHARDLKAENDTDPTGHGQQPAVLTREGVMRQIETRKGWVSRRPVVLKSFFFIFFLDNIGCSHYIKTATAHGNVDL